MTLVAPQKNPKPKGGNLDEEKLKAGFIGKIFGMGEHASRNITGAVILILVTVIAISYFTYQGDTRVLEFIKIVGPFITLGLGYLFGKNS